jgi:hypothetical protein
MDTLATVTFADEQPGDPSRHAVDQLAACRGASSTNRYPETVHPELRF